MMKPLFQIAIAFLVLLLTTASFGQTGPSVTVTLRDVAEVKGATVLLGDIAQVRAEVSEVATLLTSVRVADAPAVNSSMRVTIEDVRAALATLPLDMSQVAVNGSARVVVARSGQTVTPGDLKRAVREHILQHTGLPAEDVVLEFSRVPSTFPVSEGDLQYEVVAVANKPYSGYQAFSVCLRVGGVEVETVRVAVKIRLFRSVIVTERRISRDAVIEETDVRVERREVTNTVGAFYASLEDVMGKRARRSVSAGVLLTDVMVGEPLAVRRNEYVTVLARYGSVRVRTKCLALQDGCRGDSIDVMNKDSKTVIRARVIGVNQVEVEL